MMPVTTRSLLSVVPFCLSAGLYAVHVETAIAQKAGKKSLTAIVPTGDERMADQLARRVKSAKATEKLFAAQEPLQMVLTTNIRRIRGDRGEPPWRSAVVGYTDASGKQVTIPTQIRTRGIWRLAHCEFPPVRLNFKGEATKGTLLHGLDKPKLVSYCRDNETFDQYVVQEAQLYRVYNLLTPASHRVRLLNVTYTDSASAKVFAKRSAFLLEEPAVMAARVGGPIVDQKGALPDNLDPFYSALASVFQYFIGNTDYSIYALHNMELVFQPSGLMIAVPFDFDFSGVINASYATTDPIMRIRRVRDRQFRGFCQPAEDYQKAFAVFNEKKEAIYALYADSIGKLLKPKIVEETLRYYDDFYKTINDPKRVRRDMMADCVDTR